MFVVTNITLNAPSGKSAEVDIPPVPHRSLLTGKEFVFLGSGFFLLASGLVGCTNIQQPTQTPGLSEIPIQESSPTQVETTLLTQSPPPPTSTPPLPTATPLEKAP